MSEIAFIKLNADWVILSACNTASGDGRPAAEGLSGLARTFFYSGARALLVSHWAVSSSAATRLITDTIRNANAEPEVGRAEALRRAEMSMLDDKTLESYFSHPQFWAPFILAGESRPVPSIKFQTLDQASRLADGLFNEAEQAAQVWLCDVAASRIKRADYIMEEIPKQSEQYKRLFDRYVADLQVEESCGARASTEQLLIEWENK
jgi:hypothetical protein